ncbi:MAG: hypothetical protein GY842_18075 [bacterium]|nr:hypothetical protein [bacterium]
MKAKKLGFKAATALLSGGILLGSGNCVPDNFWVDLTGGVFYDVVDTVILDVVDGALNPDAPLEVDLID